MKSEQRNDWDEVLRWEKRQVKDEAADTQGALGDTNSAAVTRCCVSRQAVTTSIRSRFEDRRRIYIAPLHPSFSIPLSTA